MVVDGQPLLTWEYRPQTLTVTADVPLRSTRTATRIEFIGASGSSSLTGFHAVAVDIREAMAAFGRRSGGPLRDIEQSAEAESTKLALGQEQTPSVTPTTLRAQALSAIEDSTASADAKASAIQAISHTQLMVDEATVGYGIQVTASIISDQPDVRGDFTWTTPPGWKVSKNQTPLSETFSLAPPGEPQPASLSVDINATVGGAKLPLHKVIPVFQYFRSWAVAGPYDSPGDGSDLSRVFPPESAEILGRRVWDDNNGSVVWKRVKTTNSIGGWGKPQVLNLARVVGDKEEAVAYAVTTVNVSKDEDAMLWCGSDDGVKVWLNGSVVLESGIARGYKVDDDHVAVHLTAGANVLMFKVAQGGGDWELSARLSKPDGSPFVAD